MLGLRHLLQLPRGKPRRQILDDITVGVLVCGDVEGVRPGVSSFLSAADASRGGVTADRMASTPVCVVCDLIDPLKQHAEANFL